MVLTVVAALAFLAQSIIALFVLGKNRKSATYILFAAISLVLVFWALLTFIFNHNPHMSGGIWIVRLTMGMVVIQNTLFFFFAKSYPKNTFYKSKKILIFSLVTWLVAISPLLFMGLEFKNGNPNPLPGPGMPIFLVHAVTTITIGFMALKRKLKHANKLERGQLRFIIFGSIVLWVIVPISNLIFTLALQNTAPTNFTPLYTSVFSGLIAYAIVSKKLFDIKAVVARIVGYILVLVFVGLAYGLLTFALSTVFINLAISFTQSLIFVLFAVGLAFSFQPIKRFFDKLTDKIFFQDRYDTQLVLNKLSSVLAAEIKIDVIIREGLSILCQPLRVKFGSIEVLDEGAIYKFQKYGQAPNTLPDVRDMQRLGVKRVVVTDEINDINRREEFNQYDLGITVALNTQNGLVGYLLIGPKQSGTIFSDQDIRMLEIASKELAVALENARAYEKIQAFNITLQEKIRAATAELKVKNRRLKELDKAKDDFISMASHQLRTPLTTVKGYLSMMLEGDTGKLPAKQKNIVDLAYFSAQRMVFLITDLLNVSRINTGKFVIEPTPINLVEVVKSEVEQLQRTAEGHGVKLEIVLPKTFPIVMLDDNKTRQVMMNFIDNAIYYTQPGGTVRVELAQSNGAIEFKVVDTGIGVSDADKKKLFSKFFRADNAKQQRPDGTGLGLFMAKKVITAQNGSIIFESKLGKGSTFGFRFALALVAAKK